MKKALILFTVTLFRIIVSAEVFSYQFTNVPLTEALVCLTDNHQDVNISFIYNELESYITNATIRTDDPYIAIRHIVGNNPVSIIQNKGKFYLEALQHGRHTFSGLIVDSDHQPLAGAGILLLNPRDSTVITYGVSMTNGDFAIPCDKKNVLAKISCIGFKTVYKAPCDYSFGTIVMLDNPILLNPVNVRTNNTIITSDKTTYIPTAKQKQFSHTAIDLLRHMAIPYIVIAPGTQIVQDVFGDEYVIYVNYKPAIDEDIRGMNIQDVRRVEVLENPSDPRFHGRKKVINIIVQEYEYGGYTKVMAYETVLNGFSNKSDAYSKFTYRKMTYDLAFRSSNDINHHGGSDINSLYKLTDNTTGTTNAITRSERVVSSEEKNNVIPVTFRASLNTSNLQLSNTFSFIHENKPISVQKGKLNHDTWHSTGTYERNSESRANILNTSTSLYYVFPKEIALDYSQNLIHSHRNHFSVYSNSDMTAPIWNHAVENLIQFRCGMYVLKAFDRMHRVKAGASFRYLDDNVDYLNKKTFSDNMKNTNLQSSVNYTFSNDRQWLSIIVGCGFSRIRVNGQKNIEACPFGSVNYNYMPNRKSRFSLFASYELWTPGIDMRQDAIVQSNEYLYLTGNSALQPYRKFVTNAAYNFASANNLSVAAFAGSNTIFNRVATTYDQYDDGRALIRSFTNSGNLTNCYIGISGSYRFPGNKLQLYLNVSQNYYKSTGIYDTSYLPKLRVQAQASYYFGSFYALLAGGNEQCSLTENSNIIIRGIPIVYVEMGWGSNNWSISLSGNHILSSKWKSAASVQHTPLLSEWKTNYSPNGHASINLAVTYTIGYGRKVQHRNELIPTSDGGSSAIIQ